MQIIFDSLPKKLHWLVFLLSKFKIPIYYLRLDENSSNPQEINDRVSYLNKINVQPLPLEDLMEIENFYSNSVEKKDIYKKYEYILSNQLLKKISKIFIEIKNNEEKIFNIVHNSVVGFYSNSSGKLNLWMKTFPNEFYLIIFTDINIFLYPKLDGNYLRIFIPLFIFNNIYNIVIKLIETKKSNAKLKNELNNTLSKSKDSFNVSYIVHGSLKHGELFEKSLYFNSNKNSPFHKENIINFNYLRSEKNNNKLNWVDLNDFPNTVKLNLSEFCKFLFSVFYIKHINDLIVISFLYIFRIRMLSYLEVIKEYQNLKLALIDYEILCPKSLLLALEALNIKTIATQERFLLTFASTSNTILDYYFTSSDFVNQEIIKNPAYTIRKCIALGQYRTDFFFEFDKSNPPLIIKKAKQENKKIVTVLGFHTHLHWHDSKSDHLMSWKSHSHFLNEFIYLSKELKNIHFILRFKSIDWMKLNVFKTHIDEIEELNNIEISVDYSHNHSYDLCLNSDLIIAEHSSLGDEAMSIGIPVLFIEYSHNQKNIMSQFFNYQNLDIYCYSIEELIKKTKLSLFNNDYILNLKDKYKYIYGDYSDGNIKNRLQEYLHEIIKDL